MSGDEKNLEQSFVNQVGGRRSIEETLEVAWKLLLTLPEADLKRIDPALVAAVRIETAPRRVATRGLK